MNAMNIRKTAIAASMVAAVVGATSISTAAVVFRFGGGYGGVRATKGGMPSGPLC